VAEHTVKAFDEEITTLRGLIAEMGGLAELAIGDRSKRLPNGHWNWPHR
jgi:phosphate transport system protein